MVVVQSFLTEIAIQHVGYKMGRRFLEHDGTW